MLHRHRHRRRDHRHRHHRSPHHVHPVPPATVRWARRVAPLVVLALAATACAGADGGGDSAATDEGTAVMTDHATAIGTVDGEEAAARDGRAAVGGGGDSADPLTVGLPLGRRVIQTADIGLEIRDTGSALDRITAIVERADGFIASAELQEDADGRPEGTITLRVPTSELPTTLTALEGLAVGVPFRHLGSQDVTEEYADIEARLRNLEAVETELVALLAEIRASSSKASEILQVFQRVREVRTDIERLRGRQLLLDDLVALATVNVSVIPTVEVPGLLDDEGWRPGETVRTALSATVVALATIGDGLIWIGLTVLPIVALLLLPVIGGWALWRRRPRPRTPSTP